MAHVLFITGSLRKASYNSKLLEHFATHLPWDWTVDFLAQDAVSLPLFNEELENDRGMQALVESLHQRFSNADGFVIASPEYNGQVSAYLKNTIDWVSRLTYIDASKGNPFLDKPTLLSSASTSSRGGAVGISSARDLVAYVGASVIGGSICIGNAISKCSNGEFAPSDAEAAEIQFHLGRWLSHVEMSSLKGQ